MKQVKINRSNGEIASIVIDRFEAKLDRYCDASFAVPSHILKGVSVSQIDNDISFVLRNFNPKNIKFTPYPADICLSALDGKRVEVTFCEFEREKDNKMQRSWNKHQFETLFYVLQSLGAISSYSNCIEEPIQWLSYRMTIATKTFDPVIAFIKSTVNEANNILYPRKHHIPTVINMPDKELIKPEPIIVGAGEQKQSTKITEVK